MPSSYTSILGLVLPTTGELTGTWGATVNTQLTQLVEDSIAGYATTSVAAGDWTLTTTGGGASNQARMAILVPTGAPGVSRSIFAPKLSKNYVVVNRSDAAVVLRGGPGTPTTGITIAAGVAQAAVWDDALGDFRAVGVPLTSGTGSAVVPGGTTAQRDATPTNGMLRYNSDLGQFEGYAAGSWGGIGGAQAGGVIYENSTTVTSNYTLSTGKNGMSVGPITINTGITVTVPTGQRWVVL